MRLAIALVVGLLVAGVALAQEDMPVNFDQPEFSLLELPEGMAEESEPDVAEVQMVDMDVEEYTSSHFSGSLAPGRKAYFLIRVGSKTHTFQLTAQLSPGSVALLERKDHYPTLSNNDHHNYTRGSVNTLTFVGEKHSKHYIALYAWQQTTYGLTIQNIAGCSSSYLCAHGSCQLDSNNRPHCSCSSGYTGTHCNVPLEAYSFYSVKSMSISGPVEFRMPYRYNDKPFNVWVNVTNSHNYGAQVWISRHYEVWNSSAIVTRNVSHYQNIHLQVMDGVADTYYIYVLPLAPSHLSLRADYESMYQCDSDCSGLSHGRCLDSPGDDGAVVASSRKYSCVCRSGFSGDACNVMDTTLTRYPRVAGVSLNSIYNYYTYQSDSSDSSITLLLTDLAGSSHCTMYVAYGTRHATRYHYNWVRSRRPKLELALNNVNGALYSISVVGSSSCNYTLEISSTPVCHQNGGCANGGSCAADGSCICTPLWGGERCTVPVKAVDTAHTMSGSVARSQWQYYLVNTTASLLSVHVRSVFANVVEKRAGSVWLFVRRGEVPTLLSYNYDDRSTNSTLHSVTFPTQLTNGQRGAFYIGLFGTPGMLSNPTSYQLRAWASPIHGRGELQPVAVAAVRA